MLHNRINKGGIWNSMVIFDVRSHIWDVNHLLQTIRSKDANWKLLAMNGFWVFGGII